MPYLRYNRILFIILLGGGVFATSAFFVDPEISTKYHFVVLLALAGGLFSLWCKLTSSTPLSIGHTLYLTFLFVAFIVIRALCSDNFSPKAVLPFVCAWLLLFVWYKQPFDKPSAAKTNSIAIGCLAVCQALYGLYPLVGYALNGGSFPAIVGSFDNPAGYSACLVFLLPWCLFNVCHSTKRWMILWLTVCVLVTVGIVLSQSRTGLLAIACMAIVYAKLYYPLLRIWNKHYFRLFLPIIFLLIIGLYFIRPDSADGRLLIWQCSLPLIDDNLMAGSGPNGFQGNYMLSQASFFQQNPNHNWGMLADNVLHPFNELLALVVNYGIIVLLIAVFIIYHGLRSAGKQPSEETKIALLVLTGIAVFCCFSYPFRYAFTWVLTAWCLVILTKEEIAVFRISIMPTTFFLILLSLITIICVRFELKHLKAEYAWYRLAESPTYKQMKDNDILLEYADIHNTLTNHPQFLFSYGTELYQKERFEYSIYILNKCSKGLNDVEVQLLLAMNYIALEQWDSAEASLRLASQMCPNRFAPLVGLMRVYIASGNMAKARAIAQTIILKEVKITSPRVLLFIDEAERLLKNAQ